MYAGYQEDAPRDLYVTNREKEYVRENLKTLLHER